MINNYQQLLLPFATTGAFCYWSETYVYSYQRTVSSYINATYQIENQDMTGIK